MLRVGVKVAVLDSGIDATHPCFSDIGYPRQQQLGDTRFTNNKVIVARVFNNKVPSRNYTAEAIQEHGTHVAGTVACNYNTPATIDDAVIPFGISGVAPHALLGNYNLFPGDVTSTRSEDILNALDAAYRDGFDIANMSLVSHSSGIQDLLTSAVDALDQANMVVVVAAGNDGPGHSTVRSPGSAARALTAGAFTVGHTVIAPVTVSTTTYPAARGDFGKYTITAPLAVVADTTSPLGGLSLGCSAQPAGSLTSKIALISRGDCTFSVKIRNVQNAGAVGVLVVSQVTELLPGVFIMRQDGEPNQPTIPAYLVDLALREALMGQDGATTTFSLPVYRYSAADDNVMADFSSQGPTDVDARVKPDVVAPGVNVLSSIPHQSCNMPPCFAFFEGTSMATPHLAGTAAVVISQHPDWSAAQIRSAIVNTADQDVLKNYASRERETDVNVVGAGRANALSAVGAHLALDPVSVAFGAVPSGSGQRRTFNITLTNLTNSPLSLTLSVNSSTGTGVSYAVTPNVRLAAYGSVSVVVTMTADKGASDGDHQAKLVVSDGGSQVAHSVVYTFIK